MAVRRPVAGDDAAAARPRRRGRAQRSPSAIARRPTPRAPTWPRSRTRRTCRPALSEGLRLRILPDRRPSLARRARAHARGLRPLGRRGHAQRRCQRRQRAHRPASLVAEYGRYDADRARAIAEFDGGHRDSAVATLVATTGRVPRLRELALELIRDRRDEVTARLQRADRVWQHALAALAIAVRSPSSARSAAVTSGATRGAPALRAGAARRVGGRRHARRGRRPTTRSARSRST